MGIHDIRIERTDGDASPPRRVCVSFGDGHELEIVGGRSRAKLILRTPNVAAELSANGFDSDFERAVNLLRLHMPSTGRPPRNDAAPPGT